MVTDTIGQYIVLLGPFKKSIKETVVFRGNARPQNFKRDVFIRLPQLRNQFIPILQIGLRIYSSKIWCIPYFPGRAAIPSILDEVRIPGSIVRIENGA